MRIFILLLMAAQVCVGQALPSARRAATPAAVFSSGSTLNNNLTAYWKIDATSDGSAPVTRIDSGSNGQDLTDNNNVASATGKISNAGQFVTAASKYLSRADNSTLSGSDIDLSVSAWVYLDSKTLDRVIVSHYTPTGNQRSYQLYYRQAVDRFAFVVSPDGTSTGIGLVDANNFGSPSTATWYHVVAWHDSVNNLVGISVNAGTADTLSYSGGIHDSTAIFSIGSQNGNAGFFDGRIDEVGFWKNKALSAGERTELYAAGAGKTCCPFAAP